MGKGYLKYFYFFERKTTSRPLAEKEERSRGFATKTPNLFYGAKLRIFLSSSKVVCLFCGIREKRKKESRQPRPSVAVVAKTHPIFMFLRFCFRKFNHMADYLIVYCGSKWKENFREYIQLPENQNSSVEANISFCFRLLPQNHRKKQYSERSGSKKTRQTNDFQRFAKQFFILLPLASALNHL